MSESREEFVGDNDNTTRAIPEKSTPGIVSLSNLTRFAVYGALLVMLFGYFTVYASPQLSDRVSKVLPQRVSTVLFPEACWNGSMVGSCASSSSCAHAEKACSSCKCGAGSTCCASPESTTSAQCTASAECPLCPSGELSQEMKELTADEEPNSEEPSGEEVDLISGETDREVAEQADTSAAPLDE